MHVMMYSRQWISEIDPHNFYDTSIRYKEQGVLLVDESEDEISSIGEEDEKDEILVIIWQRERKCEDG